MKHIHLNVELGERSYPIYIGSQLLASAELIKSAIAGKQVCIVTNETIAPYYLQTLRAILADGYQLTEVILPDGEKYKNLESMQKIYNALLEDRHNRTTNLIALGGGVVGDMTGFAAASYQRGVNFIQIPTTLLAQVDSSVGGKTGVNHPLGKNMIGAFHQPKAVFIDVDTLQTLPDREFSAGMAEIIKYGFIADKEFLNWLGDNMSKLMARDKDCIMQAISKSCEIKAQVVASDELESGIRAILNFGHTFGHAVETATAYKVWLHGEAVGFGMLLALQMSCSLGYITDDECSSGEQLIKSAGLPCEPPKGLPSVEDFMGLMNLDKKVLDGQLRLVLLRNIGEAFVTSDFPIEQLRKTLQQAL